MIIHQLFEVVVAAAVADDDDDAAAAAAAAVVFVVDWRGDRWMVHRWRMDGYMTSWKMVARLLAQRSRS